MRAISSLGVAMQATTDTGTTATGMLAELPNDPASIFVLVLVFAGFLAVVMFGRGPRHPD